MTAVLLVWFLIAVLLSLLGAFHQIPVRMPILGAILTLALLVVLTAVPAARRRALARGPRPLIGLHLMRFVGFYFLWLYGLGVLARNFAIPAGWGDVVIAAGAALLLMAGDWRTPAMRMLLLVWNIAGVADILIVMTMAARRAAVDPGFQNAFASLPLSLLPTFVVPVVIATHALIFYWLVKLKAESW